MSTSVKEQEPWTAFTSIEQYKGGTFTVRRSVTRLFIHGKYAIESTTTDSVLGTSYCEVYLYCFFYVYYFVNYFYSHTFVACFRVILFFSRHLVVVITRCCCRDSKVCGGGKLRRRRQADKFAYNQ